MSWLIKIFPAIPTLKNKITILDARVIRKNSLEDVSEVVGKSKNEDKIKTDQLKSRSLELEGVIGDFHKTDVEKKVNYLITLKIIYDLLSIIILKLSC